MMESFEREIRHMKGIQEALNHLRPESLASLHEANRRLDAFRGQIEGKSRAWLQAVDSQLMVLEEVYAVLVADGIERARVSQKEIDLVAAASARLRSLAEEHMSELIAREGEQG